MMLRVKKTHNLISQVSLRI